jgi:hypothetical protein
MRAAILSTRESSEAMEEAGSAYIERSKHIAVDGIWSVMVDAMLEERN